MVGRWRRRLFHRRSNAATTTSPVSRCRPPASLVTPQVVVNDLGTVGELLGRHAEGNSPMPCRHERYAGVVRQDRSHGPRTRRRSSMPDVLRGQANRDGGLAHVREQRQQVASRGVSRAATRPGRAPGRHVARDEVSHDRRAARRPARTERSGVQLPGPGVRGARLGDAARELPGLVRLRTEVRRRASSAIRMATRARMCCTP